jgi:hypothetical protein
MTDDATEADRKLTLLKAFREGQIKRHFGIYIDVPSITDQGLVQADQAAMALKAMEPEGLRALEPLLDDPDPGVRSGAADLLTYVMPEKAFPILQAMAKSDELEASATARLAIRMHEYEKSLN